MSRVGPPRYTMTKRLSPQAEPAATTGKLAGNGQYSTVIGLRVPEHTSDCFRCASATSFQPSSRGKEALLTACFHSIKVAHPTGFEPVISAFGGYRLTSVPKLESFGQGRVPPASLQDRRQMHRQGRRDHGRHNQEIGVGLQKSNRAPPSAPGDFAIKRLGTDTYFMGQH